MDLSGIFKCQDCGALGTTLTQEPVTKRMICYDRETCQVVSSLESAQEHG